MDSRTVSHTAAFTINQPAETLFPLFSPEGERLWVPGWQYENLMGTTQLHEDYLFLTKSHDHGATEAIWIVKNYDPDACRVSFYKIEPEEKVGIIVVTCGALDSKKTRVEVSYTYMGLSDRGNRFTEGFTESVYEEFIGEWKMLLEAYFQNPGQPKPDMNT